MGTAKQRALEWIQSLPDDCALDEICRYLEGRAQEEQKATEQLFFTRADDASTVTAAPRLEAVRQDLAQAGFNAKLAAMQAYLARRGAS